MTGVWQTPSVEKIGKTRIRTLWDGLVGGIGLLMGLLPHVLHHVGFLVGTAFVAGSGGGTFIFGALGLLLSVPMLRRIYKRFGTWRAPAIALVIFAAMFALSSFVIGPAISGVNNSGPTPITDHNSHH